MIVIIVKLEKHGGETTASMHSQISKFRPRKHPKMDFNYTNPNHNNQEINIQTTQFQHRD